MSFAHAEKMHLELAEQGIYGGDCFATSLDSMLQNEDLPNGFYYDIIDAQTNQNRSRFENLIRVQLAKHFRNDHRAFDIISTFSNSHAPDGNPLDWGQPNDPYEVVPPALVPLFKVYPKSEWERVYAIQLDGESESERKQRANTALDDAHHRLGIFVITHNIVADGAMFMPVHAQNIEGDTHVFAVAHNGLDDLHVIDTAFPPDDDEYSLKPLIRSPHLELAWLCNVTSEQEAGEDTLNTYGDPYTRITDSDVQVDKQKNIWKYAVYPVPPQK